MGYRTCTEKPDFDNLAKMYTDCVTGIIWKDDKAITKCTAWKVRYSKNPRTEMVIMSKKDLTLSEKEEAVFKAFSPEEMKLLLFEAHKLGEIYEEYGLRWAMIQTFMVMLLFSTTALHVTQFAAEFADKLKKLAKYGTPSPVA